MRKLIGLILIVCSTTSYAQNLVNNSLEKDTLSAKEYLPDVTIVGKGSGMDIHQLPEIVGTHIFAGKKNALVVLDNVNGNIVTNNMRQVLAKVAGIHIWESDGSGIQIGVATRGLSPNRSWDFNIRQNGYDISADPFGYPEAYYNPPLQAVQRLQIVKGAGSLQYGPQMGGMMNYVMKDGSNIDKPFGFESEQTIGSFGMINTFNAVGGTVGKFHYYSYFDHRNAEGWRNNSRYKTNTFGGNVNYQLNDKLKLGIDFLDYSMLSQQPGGLTDLQFKQNAQQSLRSRNWMNIEWKTLAATVDYILNKNTKLNVKLFGLKGDRNSIGYLRSIDIADTINTSTGNYNNRTLDVDYYRNAGAEVRSLTNYEIGGLTNSLSLSGRYFYGNTQRKRNGVGDTRSDFNTNLVGNAFPSDITFITKNVAVAAENIFRITPDFIIIPGVRIENIQASANGRVGFLNNGAENKIIPLTNNRSFVLGALAAEYHIQNTELYVNITQSYRPIQFSDITANPTTDVIDPNLKDARGTSFDLGYRGKIANYLQFDVNVYHLNYDNRVGTITQQRANGSTYNFRTNVGRSTANGVEAFAELNLTQAFQQNTKQAEWSVFTSYSYTNATYQNVRVVRAVNGNLVETNLKGNKVENAPAHILRTGLQFKNRGLHLSLQASHVSETFADAANTVLPNAAATTGLIPSYTVVDFAATYKINQYAFKAGINNLTDQRYFTRRAGGYPGPGLMPSDARSFYLSVGVKL